MPLLVVAVTPIAATITAIQESCAIVGKTTAEGGIYINGSVTGKIIAQKTVVLQKQGHVDGKIYAAAHGDRRQAKRIISQSRSRG